MCIRQREQGKIISRIGDIFLRAATQFRSAYPTYISQLEAAEQRLKDDMENDGEFRAFLEVRTKFSWTCCRSSETKTSVLFLKQCPRCPDSVNKLDLKHWLNRPSEHLQKYPIILEAIRSETTMGDPDVDLLTEAVGAMRNLQSLAQLKAFQTAMGKGPMGKFEWHELVPEDVRIGISKQVAKRQA